MINDYIIYFFILSFIGYIYECIAMTIWLGRWDNRGFLFGPIIPIYGIGALIGTIVFTNYYPNFSPLSVFLIGMVGSAILEYVVHYAMEQIFHAYWWDYSSAPFNINGRICLFASIGFGVAALIIVYIINPILIPFITGINPTVKLLLAFLILILISVDTTLTVVTLSNFLERIGHAESFVNEHMDLLVSHILDESKGLNNKFYSAVDRVEEAKKRVVDERIDRFVNSMNGLSHRSINRIKKFTGKNAEKLNSILIKIKDKIAYNRNDERQDSNTRSKSKQSKKH